MRIILYLFTFLLNFHVIFSGSQSIIPGKYEAYTQQKETEKGTNSIKNYLFWNTDKSAPPLHDTPASACSCRKYSCSFHISIDAYNIL